VARDALSPSFEGRAALPRVAVQAASRRAPAVLAIGAAIGVVLAATGLVNVRRSGSSLPRGAAASVNGEIIRSADYQRTLAGVASDRRDGVGAGERRQVLDRLIDEELLVQRGIELGLPRHDRKVRADLTAAVIASAIAGSDDVQPTQAQLQAFYDENRGFFTRPGRLRLRQVFFRAATGGNDEAVRARAAEASRRLRAGEAFETVHDALGDPEVSPLPDAPLPAEKLIDYLGPTVLKAALALAAGEVSDPVRSGTGYHVLQVIDRQPDVTPALAEIRPQVVAEFRRRAGDQALRAYLDDLRARANIAVDPKLQ
jgi:parvulin-like peptidyl-prolyl isomerase